MQLMRMLFVMLICVLTVAGCNNQSGTPAVAQDAASASTFASIETPSVENEIAWYQGTVDEAFAHAQTTQKPIFLYWGAVWCPPCHEIKVTVFDTPEFVQRSRLFVPVYLDGDTENAQAIGERFGVLGYPTMIVFAPDGTEITRIPGGIDMQAYATILDLTLQNAKPVGELLTAVLDNQAKLSGADCSLLAFYSWNQNNSILADRDRGEVFRQLYEACPPELAVDRSRLYLNYLSSVVEAAQQQDDPVPMTDEGRAMALTQLHRIVDNYQAVKANIYSILFDGADFSKALTTTGSAERSLLERKYQNAFARIVDDESIFKTERLYTLIGKIGFERIDNEEAALSTQLQEEIRTRIAWADSSTTDPYARQTVINGASNVLEEAGMSQDARALLTAEIDKSRQPYYFMVSLADVEQADGNYELALTLLKNAYDQATGPATRFQWGTYYVNGLIEMTPDDTTSISDAVMSVISEIEAEQAFYQRSTRYLNRMERKLKAWNEQGQYKDSIDQIRTSVLKLCSAIPADKSSRQTCETFLETA